MSSIRDKFKAKKYEQVELTDVLGQDEEHIVNHGGIEERLEVAGRCLESFDLRQKVRLLSGLDLWHLKPIPSLRIPSLWMCNGPHGLRRQVGRSTDPVKGRVPATCFPTASALACSWDLKLLKEVGVALGRECVAENVAVLLGPGINIIRTPLGGRNFEYFSEDPLLTGHLAAAMVQGIQSQGVAACPKHFCANNQETDRWIVDTIVDERTMRELYWKPWELVVTMSQPWTIMCAYNKINGLYCSENRVLNKRILRDEWGFQGVVMTDWGGTNRRWKGLLAGVDLEMPGSGGAYDYDILEAYYDGRVKEEDIDECGVRILSLMMLGTESGRQAVRAFADELAHHQLAYRAAVNSCVLLKNENSLLPLKAGTSLAVIGNFAAFPRIQGLGSSQVLPTKVDCAFDRFQDHTLKIHGVQGYSDTDNEALRHALLDEALDAARENEVVILFLGIPDGVEMEGLDRDHMDLPEAQEILLDKILGVNPNTVVVLTNGSPITMPWAKRVPSILEGWLGGQSSGSAIADIIFGQAEPSGKLAQTFPMQLEDVPAHKWAPDANRQVQYREAMNVGYRYFNSTDKAVLFPFGHGLTYTTFDYSDLKVTVVKDSEEEIQVDVSVVVTNIGERAGAEIVQCYVYDVERTLYRPYHELQSFEKVHLQPNESQTVRLDLDEDAFTIYDVGVRSWIVEPGDFEIQVGASSRDIRLKSIVTLASGQMPSSLAKIAHPNKSFPLDRLPESDKEFEAMLGYEIPIPPAPTGLFDYNTLVGEIKTSTVGVKLFDFVESSMLKQMDNKDDPIQLRLQRAMMETMPLRGLVVFSRGMLTFDILDLLLSLMNGEYAYTKALCMAPALILSWLIMMFSGNNNSI
jgi:beta-glucosidase